MRFLWLSLFAFYSIVVTSSAFSEGNSLRRSLLKSQKDLAELEREDNALEAYHLQQASLNKEQESLLHFGSEQATTVVRKFNKGNRKTQVKLFVDLWENAEGVTIVKSLAMLIEISPKKRDQFFSILSDSLDQAENNGYGFKVSEALYHSMAVRDTSRDHYLLLDALVYRMEQKDSKKKGSGCQYIQFLFSDAESWALDDGRARQFFQGFDNTDYLSLVECFLTECTGSAAKCCSNSKAVSSGMCNCKIINKKKGTRQCDHNLFWTAPRTIWLCGLASCKADQKCLCPKPGTAPKKNSKTKTKANNKKSTKDSSKKQDKSKTGAKKKSSAKGKSKSVKKTGRNKGKRSKRT